MKRKVWPYFIVARGDQRNDAARIGELFVQRHGVQAVGDFFDASLSEEGDTVILTLSRELRDFAIRQPGWMEWYAGEPFPLHSSRGSTVE